MAGVPKNSKSSDASRAKIKDIHAGPLSDVFFLELF